MSQENVLAMLGLYEAFARGDLDTFQRGVSRDILWNEAENSLYSAGNPYRSFAEVHDGVLAPTERDYENFRVEVEKLLDAGDYVISTGRYRGRNRKTGKELSAQFCHVIHVDSNGKLDRVQEYADTLHEAEVHGRTQIVQDVRIPQPVG